MKSKKMDAPKKLYKYQDFNNYSLANLKNNQIFFSNPFEFNDPFDCSIKLKTKQLTKEDYKVVYRNYINKLEKKDDFIRHYGDIDNIKKIFKDEVDRGIYLTFDDISPIKKTGVCCFSEKYDDLLMWSHYSNGHRGFCLEFDTSIEPFNKAEKVHYSPNIPEISPIKALLNNPDGDPEGDVLRMLKIKSDCWAYEKEWRIFHQELNKLYGFSNEALTGVYFGAKMDYTHIEIISLILEGQNPNVKLYEGKQVDNKYEIIFNEVKYTSYIKRMVLRRFEP